ncbi:MAG TPA: acyl-CoA dehydrogenase family protein [Chloroflexota bacterium]|nr:acyl-CoA dehydrogenase family protein [Chloroflexota bacterium]
MDFQLTPEQRELQMLVRTVARRELVPLASRWDRSHEFPWASIKPLTQIGVLGLTIPQQYGGLGGSWFEAVLAIEEIASACYQTAMAVLGELGVQTQAIVHFGSEAHKQRYLPPVARGELMCAICMTEADVGSDLGALTTRAVADGDGYVINGGKVLISRADVAGVFLTFVRFGDTPGSQGVGAVLIDRDTPGLEIGRGEETLGGEHLFAVYFRDVRVPAAAVLVKEHGFKTLMSAFNGQRCLNAAISLGQARGAFEAAVAYVDNRRQFGQRLSDFQGIQWMLADMAIELDAARLLIYRAASNAGAGLPDVTEAAMAKTFANEVAIRVSNQAMQLFGGHGYLKSMPVERFVRGARFGALAGGTPQIQRNLIARSLLARRRSE